MNMTKWMQAYLKAITTGILIFMLTAAVTQSGQTRNTFSDDDDPESTEVVVKLSQTFDVTIDEINASYGTNTLEELLGSRKIFLLQTPPDRNAETIAEQMKDDERILYAEPNFVADTPEGGGRETWGWGGTDPKPGTTQYATTMLRLAEAHTLRRGESTVVAILDTGIQLTHPALTGSVSTVRYDFIDDDTTPIDEGNNQDDDRDGLTDEALGHGTHVAGIVHLVAPDAEIMPLRVLDADGRGNVFVIVEAILYAAQNGAHVINLSLGTPQESELMEDIIEDVIEQYQVVVVAAAGNLNSNTEQFPASEEQVLAVASIDEHNTKSDFSNYGDWIDVSAPGDSIYSAVLSGGYAWWSGTSMAVPFVAGQAALIRSAVPAMSAASIVTHIRESALPIDDQNPNYEEMLGKGRIDIGGSLLAMCDPSGICTAPDQAGKITLELRGTIDGRPQNGPTGTWIIAGVTLIVDDKTEIDQDDGSLVVGGCADVEYLNTNPFTALKIRFRQSRHCENRETPTPLPTSMPTETPLPSSTLNPTATATPTPSGEATATVTPRLTGTPTAEITPTVQSTETPTPTLTPSVSPTPQVDFIVRGQIEQIVDHGTSSVWVIDGISYAVTSETALDTNLVVGTRVVVHGYQADDNRRIAVHIQRIDSTHIFFLPILTRS